MISKINIALVLSLTTLATTILKVILIGEHFELEIIGWSTFYISLATIVPNITNSLLSEVILLKRSIKNFLPHHLLQFSILLGTFGFCTVWIMQIISLDLLLLLIVLYVLALFSDFVVLGARYLSSDKTIFQAYFLSNLLSVTYLSLVIFLFSDYDIETLILIEIIQQACLITIILFSLKSKAVTFLSDQENSTKMYSLRLRLATILSSLVYQRLELIFLKMIFGVEFLGAFNLLNMTFLNFGNRFSAMLELFILKDMGDLVEVKKNQIIKKYTRIVLISMIIFAIPGFYLWTNVLSVAIYDKYIMLQSILFAYFIFAISKMLVIALRPLLLALQNHNLNFSILAFNYTFILTIPLIFYKLNFSNELFYYTWGGFYCLVFCLIQITMRKGSE